MDGRLSKNAEGRGKRRESLCNTNLSLSRPGYWNLLRHIFECLEIYSGDIALLESLGIYVTIYNPERRLFPFISGRRVRARARMRYRKYAKLREFGIRLSSGDEALVVPRAYPARCRCIVDYRALLCAILTLNTYVSRLQHSCPPRIFYYRRWNVFRWPAQEFAYRWETSGVIRSFRQSARTFIWIPSVKEEGSRLKLRLIPSTLPRSLVTAALCRCLVLFQ